MTMKIQSLNTKIVLLAVTCLVLTAGMVVVYSVHFLRERAMVDAKEQLLAIARAQAANVQAEMTSALDSALTLSQVLSEVKDHDNPLDLQRYEAMNLLRGILVVNPKFYGIFTCWEEKAYDYLDSGFVNEEGHDASGRFAPYWQRNQSGEPELSPLLVSPHHSLTGQPEVWYEMTRRSMHDQVQGPIFIDKGGDNEQVIAVAVAPILPDNDFVGVVGIDVDLTFLQTMADKISIFNNLGKMSIIGNNGTIVAFTGKRDYVGQRIEQVHTNAIELQQRIRQGKEVVEILDGLLHAFTPVQIGRSDRSWAVAIVVPVDKVVDASMALMWKQIIIFAALTLLILIAALFGARSITKPLSSLVEGMQSIKEGDFSKKLDIRSHDEIGKLATMFNLMRVKIYETLHDLQEHQEKLEEKVSQRTIQIKKTNEELNGALEAAKEAQEHLLQTEKLAVVGQMSGIVAHEVLNPVAAVSIRVETNIEQANRTLAVIDKMNTLLVALQRKMQSSGDFHDDGQSILQEQLPMLVKIGASLKKNQEARLDDFHFLDRQMVRVVRIVDNLRQMSKSQKFIEPVYLDKLVNEVLEDMSDGMKKRKITVISNISPVPLLKADQTELYSIVSNLVRNAMQSVAKQYKVPERKILVHLSQREDNFLELVIHDNGIGIDPENRQSIFEPGFTNKGRKGTGLGLSFSRKVARSYHGDIVLLEHDGEGAAFQVLLPLDEEVKGDAE